MPISQRIELRPGPFCRFLLKALDAAEGQTKRRKRDQAPDKLGLAVKRDLLERAVEADPDPDAFEGWLMQQVITASAPGAVRAMCEQIFIEYRMASLQPDFAEWLTRGAPSDDADAEGGRKPHRSGGPTQHERWHGLDEQEYACTCHLPL
jgi:hypothetical protein